MAINSLYPAFVQIQYHSAYAPHVMTLPTTQWTPDLDYGTFACWDGSDKAADDMVEELVLLMVPFFKSTVQFDYWTVYTMADPTAPAIPRKGAAIGEPGTSAGTGWDKATQATWSFKTEDGGLSKVVMLDLETGGAFGKITPAGLTGDAAAFVAKWTADTEGWSGRDNSKPDFFLQISYTLNEKLRREYHLN